MAVDTNKTDENRLLDELDDERLRLAVVQVRESALPEDALARAMSRAEESTLTASAARRQPGSIKTARRRLGRWVTAVCLMWLIVAGVTTYQHRDEIAQEAANEFGTMNYAYCAGSRGAWCVPFDDDVESGGYQTPVNGFAGVVGNSSSIELFQCPSESAVTSSLDYGAYTGYIGEANELFGKRTRNVSGNGIVDGTSNTFAMGEGAGGDRWPLAASASQKKVVQTATISLVVKELAKAETQVGQLVQKHNGEIANSQISQAQGQQRAAQWVVRVPAGSVDALLHDLAGLGIAENRTIGAQDVTEEYIDLETRIASKKQLETRILDLLEKKTGDIKDVLAVEEQLARVRSEIESMVGRKKYLDSVTAMATVTVSAREQAEYVPPEVSTFSGQVDRTWTGSLKFLQGFGKSLVLVAVAAGPWLPLVAAAMFGLVWMWRRRRQRKFGEAN
jgi:hypothetical protein